MSKNTPKGSGINKKTVSTDEKQRLEENTINIWVTLDEKKFLNKMASLLNKIHTPNNTTMLPENSLSALNKMCLTFTCNFYRAQILMDSRIAASLPDKEALNEFIAFRRDYMNFPVDKQIADLKRVGIVK
jgi:hypothetical protein